MEKKGYTSVTYGSRMLKMMQDGASAQLRRLLENIDVIRIISTEEFPAELEKQAQETAADDCYELVSEVGSGEVSTAFFFGMRGQIILHDDNIGQQEHGCP